MGDMGEGWDQYKVNRQAKKLSNKEQSIRLLIERKVYFESRNNEVHLIVRHNDFVVDFWPSTGKFIFRNAQINGRGVFNLLKYLGE